MSNHQPALVQPPLNNPPTPIEDPQPTVYQDEPVEEPLDNSYTEHQDIVEPEQSVSSEPGKINHINFAFIFSLHYGTMI